MFSSDESISVAPAPVLFDYVLPDALLRAREAALLVLRPAVRARGRELTESQAQLLRILVRAGEPLSQLEARRRCGFDAAHVGRLARQLVGMNYAEWIGASGPTLGGKHPKLAARDIGRRHINHISRAVEAEGGESWQTLAARPPDARFTEPMRKRLFGLLTKVRRTALREPVLEGANVPDDAGDDLAFGLPLQLRLTRKALLARTKKILAAHELTEAQWRLLRILAEQPGIGWTVRGLGRRGCFHYGAPVVTRALFTLSQRGLVRRAGLGERPAAWRRPSDPQKRWRVEIARDGVDLVRRIETKERDACADLFERLDAREIAELDRLLLRLTLALLWQDGPAPEDQAVHPFGAEYDRLDAINADGTRARERRNKIYRENGMAIPPARKFTHWYD